MTLQKTIFGYLLLLVFILSSCMNDQSSKPVTPGASPEAVELLDYIYSIKGNKTLSGQHNYIHSPGKYTERAYEITGKYPVIWGSDFSFRMPVDEVDSVRGAMINEAIRQHEKGAVITLMWHTCFPLEGEPCSNKTIWHRKISEEQWEELTTPGTDLNTKWKELMDNIVPYLKILQEKHIPVLWRPYHEMNGIWFWWGHKPGKDGYQKLWKMTFDYLVNDHQINNLLWVWNANAPRNTPGDEAYAYVDYFPGNEYVDILAADVYHNDYRKSHHDQLVELGQGKPIALGEVGKLPTPRILDEQNQWTWFMCWSNWLWKENDPDEVKKLYNHERVTTLKEKINQ